MMRRGKSNGGDSWNTDEWILEMFDGWFDPCPFNPDFEVDGTRTEWPDAKVFINPPYSNVTPFVERAIQHPRMVVLLLKHDSSTEWYRMLHEAGARFLLVQGRLRFQSDQTAAFPSVLAVLDEARILNRKTPAPSGTLYHFEATFRGEEE